MKFAIHFYFVLFISSQTFGQSGMLDPTFDTDGIRVFPSMRIAYDVKEHPADGGIYSVGYYFDPDELSNDMIILKSLPNGATDLTFGGQGFDFAGRSDILQSLDFDADGKIVLMGFSEGGGNSNIKVIRMIPATAMVDPSFGVNGIVTFSVFNRNEGRAIVVQPDGKILVVGLANNGGSDLALIIRLDTNGNLDNSFNGIGYRTLDIGSLDDQAISVDVQLDGKIVLVGRANTGTEYDLTAIRLNDNGSFDNTFSGDGIFTFGINATGFDQGSKVKVLSSGKILVGGMSYTSTNRDFLLLRLNDNGTLDLTFNGVGYVTTPVGSGTDECKTMVVQPNGKVILAGTANIGTDRFALVKYNDDGTLDTSFGTGGKVTHTVTGIADQIVSISLQGDGKIIAAGFAMSGGNPQYVLSRYLNSAGSSIRYVRQGATGDGLTWATPSGDLQAMINAPDVTEVWVAQGTYFPTSGSDRTISFQMKNGVAIYGGFPPSGDPVFADRNLTLYPTILSGDIGTLNVNTDNSYRVIVNSGLGTSAVLDGFTIRDGNANGASPYNNGGGMHNTSSSPMVTNCIFTQNLANSGGAMYNITSSAPNINSCTFTSNTSVVDGGALHHTSSTLSLTNCTFTTNAAVRGGAVYLSSSNATMTNCTFTQNNATDDAGAWYFNLPMGSSGINNCNFSQNSATNGGGAIYVNSANTNAATVHFTGCKINNNTGGAGGAIVNNISNTQFTNCEIAGNSALTTQGGGIYNNNTSSSTLTNCTLSLNTSVGAGDGIYNNINCDPVIKNCILWNNGDGIFNNDVASVPVISYSIIQGNNSGGSIINANPLFVNGSLPNFDLHLNIGSPAINQSDPASVSPVTDLDGVMRVGVFDIGAYEAIYTFPSITLCPSNQSIDTDPGECSSVLNYVVQADGNPSPTFTYAFTGDLTGSGTGTGTGTAFPPGITEVTVTATSGVGSDNCIFTVTVTDNEDPDTPSLSTLTGECEVVVPVPAAFDNCAGNITGTTTDPLIYDVQGTFTVTWTFDDGNGNVVNVDQDVIVDDITLPVLDCPATMDVALNTDCELVIPGEYYIPDPNISNAPMGWSKAFPANLPAYGSMGGLEPTGLVGWQNGAEAFPMAGDFVIEYKVTIYSAGGIGNGDCMFGYTKVNPDPANLLVHGYSNDDQAVYVYFDQGYMISSLFGLTWDNPVSFNAVVGNTVTIRMQRTGPVISYLITGVGPDKMGIIENNNPDLIYPIAVFYNVGCKLNYAKIISGSSVRPIGQDNCSYVLTTDPPIGTTFNSAHNQVQTVEITITDEGGNNETCNIDLIAKDLSKPVLTNPGNQTINAPLGTCQAPLFLSNPMMDNCSGGSWTYQMTGATTHSASVANGTSLSYNSLLWGVTHIVLGATDAAGNVATEVSFDVTVNSITTEVCDLVDNNCNGLIDEGVLLTFYPDADGDGFGSTIGSIQGCTVPMGYVSNAADCDDGNFFISAGQAEICDGLDNNCNGWVDENLPCSNNKIESFDEPGLDTIIVPSGVTGISAQVWGGGAGGGSNGSGGGGGGAFRQGMIPVVLNQDIEFTIGDGGSGGNSGNASGNDGESSSIGSIVAGGGHASNGLSGGAGGSGSGGGGGGAGGGGGSGEGGGGGSGSGGGGGGGGGGASGAGGGGGGGGGSGAGSGGIGGAGGGGAPGGDAGGNGGNGAPGTGMPGAPGVQPGGGGGGGGNGADGGSGANGSIIIQFQCPAYNLNSISVTNPSCSNGIITINSDIADLPAGQYTVRYNVSGDAAHNNQSSAMMVNTPGTGDFMLLTLMNGNYQITVTHIESGVGIVCSSEILSNNTLAISIADVEICNNGMDDNCDGNIDEVGTLYRTIQPGDYYTDATWENGCPPPAIIPPGTMVKVLHPVINMGTITNNGDIVIQGGTFLNRGLYKGRGEFAGSMINEGTISPGN
ncbi:MAG: hypothetical protein IPN29_17370 [Saprospiraceae bacterium]|nr:hypothetical protein [Saprospiraceae bacterium]